MIDYDVKFITCDESTLVKNFDNKSFKYETKKRSEETVFDAGKRNFHERRGGQWRTPRPRQLKQLESKLHDKTVVKTIWTTESLITLVFSSGAIAYLSIKLDTLDVKQILFDRYFVGKLSGQTVTNVALCKSHLLFVHNDRTATLVTFSKNNNSCTPCRIPDRDPSLHSIELGGSNRRSERHITCSDTPSGSRILVWSVTTAEPAPWSPVLEDLANLHLYQVNGHNISLIAHHQLEHETLSAELSHNEDNIVHVIEQITCQKNGVSLEWIRYDIPSPGHGTKLCARAGGTLASLPAAVKSVRRAPCDSRLLVACIDGSLHIIHHIAGLMHSTKAGFITTDVRWVNELIVASEEGGRLQCFDRALSSLHHHTKCFDLNAYFRESRRMQVLGARSTKAGSVLLVSFFGGPLTLLRIRHPRLLTAWIRARRMSNGVALLKAMDWDLEGTECLWAVNRLVCAALRSGPEAVGEEWSAQAALGAYLAPAARVSDVCVCTEAVGEEWSAQAALGAYLAPAAPLGARAARYAPPVHDLARKFFHHLLRRGRIEKALSLAVELRAWDLCRDCRAASAARHLPRLAAEAAALAAHYQAESECSESCSDCSSHSYSEAETASSEIKPRPPPLPRVSLPPAILPVPVSQPEPISTSSIRPNLHQYLDRDNTIWNTETQQDYKQELRPILNTQNAKWHDNGHYKKDKMDVMPRQSSQFKHVFQTDVREETPTTLYRYQNYPPRNDGSDRQRSEKNKVKFSDTVTIAVVSSQQERIAQEDSQRELAASLPLCAPHRYLSAFTPAAPPPAGTTDYVEV